MKSRGNILVVDDNLGTLKMMVEILQSEGYQTRPANSGELALMAMAAQLPDLVLLDIRMPGIDGFEVCRRMKADPRTAHIPIIFLSAEADQQERVEVFALGAVDFVAKPFQREELLARIGTHLELWSLRRHLEEEVERQTCALKATTSELQATLNAIPDLLLEMDADGRFCNVHSPDHTVMGIHEDAMPGKLVTEIFPAAAASACMDAIHEAGENGVSIGRQLELSTPEESILLELSVARKDETALKEARFIVLARDITERKHAEDERKRLEEQLRQAQKMEAIGTLAGGIAHDFNNILNVIIGYGSMLLERLTDDPRAKQQLTDVLAAADRAATLTRRLLAFSRKQVAEVKQLNLNDIVFGIEKMLSRIVSEDIDFTLEVASRKMIVMADSGQIEQVLLNLVSNARHAMPEGGKLTISTGIKEMDENSVATFGYGKPGMFARISVADTGSGMDQETMKRIFEPFFTTKEVGEGTGLGLSIVYGIIKQHEGYVNVRSEPGKGTEFEIYLPLVAGDAEKTAKVGAELPVRGGTETILIAEDDPQLRELARVIFEPFGYKVLTAENGEDAIARFRENSDSIDMVILDMIMPKKSGKEAYEEIRKIRPDIKSLFVSGYTMDVIRQRNLMDEGMEYILKPVFPNKFLKKVREVLDR